MTNNNNGFEITHTISFFFNEGFFFFFNFQVYLGGGGDNECFELL